MSDISGTKLDQGLLGLPCKQRKKEKYKITTIFLN